MSSRKIWIELDNLLALCDRRTDVILKKIQLRDILATSPDPILVVDPYDCVSFANPAAERIFSLQPQNCVDLIPHGCRKLAAQNGG